MKKSDEYSESKNGAYAKQMASVVPRVKIQRPVTQAQALFDNRDKDSEAYKAWQMRPLPTEEQWKGTTPERDVPIELALIVHGLRQSSKNTQGDFASEGLSSVAKESKEKAMSAFTCSPPAELTTQQVTKLIELNSIPTPPAPVIETKAKDGFWSKLFKPKKVEVDKNSLAYHLYKISGGKDEDFK